MDEHTTSELKEYFQEKYPHIYFNLTEKGLTKWLKERPYLWGKPLFQVADSLADYLLARGVTAIE